MPLDFTIQNMDGYLYVTVRGDINAMEDVLIYGDPLKSKAEELGLTRALIDYRGVREHLNFYEMVRLAKHIGDTKRTYRRIKVVHLIAPTEVRRFADYQTPALNRGFVFESFTDEREALAWLFAN